MGSNRGHRQLGVGRSHCDVNVADRLDEASKAAAPDRVLDAVHRPQRVDQPLSDRESFGDGCPSLLAGEPESFDGFRHLGFTGCAHTGQRPELLGVDGSFQLRHVLNSQSLPDQLERLRTHSRDAAEFDDRRRELSAKAVEFCDGACVDKLANLGSRGLANSLDGGQFGRRQLRRITAVALQAVAGRFIGSHPKRLRAALGQCRQSRQFVEHFENVLPTDT